MSTQGQLVCELVVLTSLAEEIGGSGASIARCKEVAERQGDRLARVVEIFGRWVEESPRRPCPECRGRGMVRYSDVGEAPCMTCGGMYERGRGWLEAVA